MNVAIRTDSSLAIGTGHLMRCLALADELGRNGTCVRFLCRELGGNLIEVAERTGFEVLRVPTGRADPVGYDDSVMQPLGAMWESDARQTVEMLAQQQAEVDWLVIDHYAFGVHWESAVRPCVSHLMVIDDLADRHHDCDVLLDTTLGRTKSDYRDLVPRDCRLLVGPAYALLRPQFAEARAASLERRREHGRVQRILVTMGGADPRNITCVVLDAIGAAGVDVVVDVVLGARSPHFDSVRACAAAMPVRIRLHVDVYDMAQLMALADLAIGTGGTTSWERCCLGVPSLVITDADHQLEIATALERHGAARVAGWHRGLEVTKLAGVIRELCSDAATLHNMSTRAAQICDGRGVLRVRQALMGE